MTATMPRPVTKWVTDSNEAPSPVGQNSQQPRPMTEPKIRPAAASTNVPEQCAQLSSDAHHDGGMLLWDPLLQTLASGLDDMESVRRAQANRLRVLTTTTPDSDGVMRGFGLDDKHPAVAVLAMELATIGELENAMTKALAKQLKVHPLHPWIKAQCGLGDKQVARLLAAIHDPYWNDLHDRPRTVSELWAYCGLHVLPASHTRPDTQTFAAAGAVDGGSDTGQTRPGDHLSSAGVAPARRRGQKPTWNNEARARIYVIAESCMKNRRSPYRAVYDTGRAKYAEAVHAAPCAQCGKKGQPAQPGTDLRDGHKHARAMRLVMKTVLRDLWIESRRIYLAAEAATT